MSTFEIWTQPTTDLPDVADHTFVYCTNKKKIFGCWASGDIQGKDAQKIARASWRNAYSVADCYRKPAFNKNDTAGVGIYGVNGVCHQSANLFFYAVSSKPMGGKWINGELRPRGIWASYAAYGPYGSGAPIPIPGTPIPIITAAAFFPSWLLAVYNPCRNRQGVLASSTRSSLSGSISGIGEYLLDLIRKWLQAIRVGSFFRDLEKLYLEADAQKLPTWKVTAREVGFLTKQFVSDLDLSGFEQTHGELLKEKADMITADWKETPNIGEPLAERINDWGVTLQKELEGKIGGEAYQKLTGLPAGQQVRVIDPEIASGIS